MKELMRAKAQGLSKHVGRFARDLGERELTNGTVATFTARIQDEMSMLGFDTVTTDKVGNLVGVIKGYKNNGSLVVISHMDIPSSRTAQSSTPFPRGLVQFKAGIIAGVYGGALLKRTLLPLTGDLIVCCVPRFECCDSAIKYLFEDHLSAVRNNIKGVILCEPTDFNINLGHKGRMEYEIVVKNSMRRDFIQHRGMNMLGTMFPLINELEQFSRTLPHDTNLGGSNLRIKDVRYSGPQTDEMLDEFKIVVDRAFLPEENMTGILHKAQSIAANVYQSEPDVSINTAVASENVTTHTGVELMLEKEVKPWVMEGHHPFALGALACLNENGFKSSFGYWKKIVTEGSYTHAQLAVPTIGFGAGSEDMLDAGFESLSMATLEKAVLGQAFIIQRHIGMTTFGWSSDEI